MQMSQRREEVINSLKDFTKQMGTEIMKRGFNKRNWLKQFKMYFNGIDPKFYLKSFTEIKMWRKEYEWLQEKSF